jgi:hypothetical protein
MGNSFLKELRGRGPVADTGRDESPMGAFAPQGNFLDGRLEAYLGETTAGIENTLF